jgi:hypothetical protein
MTGVVVVVEEEVLASDATAAMERVTMATEAVAAVERATMATEAVLAVERAALATGAVAAVLATGAVMTVEGATVGNECAKSTVFKQERNAECNVSVYNVRENSVFH